MAVWLSWFLLNFGRETRLMVCERPKFSKSAKSHTPEQIVAQNLLPIHIHIKVIPQAIAQHIAHRHADKES